MTRNHAQRHTNGHTSAAAASGSHANGRNGTRTRTRTRLRKRMLWKDIRVTMAKSKGRFLSIVSLMALGSFALVGLFVTGPDMRITGTDFFNQNNLADITVISDYGLTKADENIIRSAPKWPRR